MARSKANTTTISYVLLMLNMAVYCTLAQTTGRFNSCCGLMGGKVYCYGGRHFTNLIDSIRDNYITVLDITKLNGVSYMDMQGFWRSVAYIRNNVDLTPRGDPQCAVMSDQNRMIINGGYSDKQLDNANVMYDAVQNEWSAQSNYTEAPYGKRQIYSGSSSYVPGKGVALYGGKERFINPNWTTPNTDVTMFTFASGVSRTIGFTQIAYFNVDDPAPTWNTPVPLTTPSDQFLAGHQSIFDPVTNMLLFMGGEYRTSASNQSAPNLYSQIKTFNTLTNEWGAMTLDGAIPTPNRLYSTLTLLPSTNRHVLLYGGEIGNVDEIGGTVAQDYCYVLNLDTKNWTRQSIDAPAGTDLQRSRHSSVLVNNNTLFVVLGIQSNKGAANTVLILNTTNPDAITMSEKFIDPNVPNAAQDSNGNTVQPDPNGNAVDLGNNLRPAGLSSGAKAGITVTAVAVVILGALVIWLCLRNKKKERIRNQERELARQQQQQADYYHPTDNMEPMEVDWDQMEEKYLEIPASKQANNSEQFGSIRESTASTTLVNRGGTPNSTSYAVYPDAVEGQRPNEMDLSHPPPQRVLKPDVGI